VGGRGREGWWWGGGDGSARASERERERSERERDRDQNLAVEPSCTSDGCSAARVTRAVAKEADTSTSRGQGLVEVEARSLGGDLASLSPPF
jgi:hypothetical protein